MPPPSHSRPENVLKRAQELIGVGQSQAALSILHEHVTSKRTRSQPIASLEPVMILFVELCVELRRGKLAKDGLYQYKNTAQNTNVGTIELVFKKFIELAEHKVAEAQKKADEVQSSLESSETAVEDLEAIETPESILLSTVSGEQSRDRTDRAIVTPWLKFLWETYRTVLDIFKNNARLEIMYQGTAHQAFAFCSKYGRKTEFRRLCELLRNHLQNAAKFSSQMNAINLSDPDTLQRHLDTRFQQLNVAVELELWQEAFRSVEDIHNLMNLSKRPPKNVMMANYFEKLTRIFLVSENYLFHAAAWSRYFSLMRQSQVMVASGQGLKKDNPAISDADMVRGASFVLLSALAIPVISTSRSRGALVDVDEAKKNKNTRLTSLLGMSTAPTRAGLFKDALAKGLLKRCRPEIRELYRILEVDFHPLSICKKISPILAQIGNDPEMEKYVLPLRQVILTRLFQQLSQVYESVELSFVLNLAQFPEPFQVTRPQVEKFIMNGCKKGDLAIRVDHATGVLTFDSDVFSSAKALHPGAAAGSAESETSSVQRLQSTPAEIVRSQIRRLAKSLYVTCQYVDPSFNEARLRAKEAAHSRTKAGAEQEHRETLARRDVIERKKQAASTALALKEQDLAAQKRRRAQELMAAERERLQKELADRNAKRLQAEKQKVQEEEAQRALEELTKLGGKGIDLTGVDLKDLSSAEIRQIKLRALEKEKNELSEKLRVTGKRIDHLERAFRKEEVKHLPEDYEQQLKRDLAAYEKAKVETLRDSEEKHKEDVALKHRLSRLLPTYETFRDDIRQQRRAEFERRRREAERELQRKIDARKKEHKDRKIREKREQEERERMEREEEERQQQEEEERARAEEERRAQLLEEKAERDEQRKKLDEVAARQRQREEEAEARRAAQRAGPRGAAPPVRAPEVAPLAGAGGPPRLNIARKEGQLTWREKEALRAAGGAEAATPAETETAAPATETSTEEHLAPRPGKFMPPALREGGAPSGGWRSREASHRGEGSGREESPAAVPRGRFQPPGGREGATGRWQPAGRRPDIGERSASGRGEGMERSGSGRGFSRDRGESPLPPPSGAPAEGRYRPGAFRQQRG
ncbi:hypothetical protein P152DRAFT_183290 [Eremomyces bilateralis CBS 781.70]|uniref:Eukaryotic translation initiation factor 3 subunit A n=1 Tax=Eremomyces bilateralis CBS 781.70 TaxID=1392243 RepID=A0A6G1GBU6_9PEZI|nr:uncharacterized protein P152DRAFT_183290 [Eremomyces bilateralis CBS 781.70]KAF1815371.1 hypothetical protein P152DRAFT_183290 [Eremomyces bilateralis CBS 781.70]